MITYIDINLKIQFIMKILNYIIKKRGYTLPELIITILLMGILFSLGLTFSSNMKQAQKLKDYSIAVALAQQAIEIVRSSSFELLDDEDVGNNSAEYDLNTDSGDEDGIKPNYDSGSTKYKRIVTITDIKTNETPNRSVGLKHVKVVIEWETDGGTKSEPFVMETTVADMN